jgi:hypothetical protein
LTRDLLELRLRNQRLTRGDLRDSADVVSWLGAVQSQDYAGGRWGVALRTRGVTAAAFDRAFDRGSILRTHVLRPTWHFVPRADIRWMLSLTAPRLLVNSASAFRRLEIDDRVASKCRNVFVRALGGGKQLTRAELSAALADSHIRATGQRLAHIMFRAELEMVVCSGPRRGRQFTYMLLDDRAPGVKALGRQESLAELALRYFRSHGPATLRDFTWWSGLRVKDSRAAVAALGKSIVHEQIDGLDYWLVPSRAAAFSRAGSVYLLPNYDEYVVAYRDRGVLKAPVSADAPRGVDLYSHPMIVNGLYAGTWRREEKRGSVRIVTSPVHSLTRAHGKALSDQVARMSTFLDAAVTLA